MSFDCTPPWCGELHESCWLWVEGGGSCHAFYTLVLLVCSHNKLVRSWGFMSLVCRRSYSVCCLLMSSWNFCLRAGIRSDFVWQDGSEVWICLFWAHHIQCRAGVFDLNTLHARTASSRCQCQTFFHLNTDSTWSEQACSLRHWEDWLQQTQVWCLATPQSFATSPTSLVQPCFIHSYCHLTRNSWGSKTTQLIFVRLSCLAVSAWRRLDSMEAE